MTLPSRERRNAEAFTHNAEAFTHNAACASLLAEQRARQSLSLLVSSGPQI